MAVVLFLLFLILKQFYLFPSGSIGIGDLCLGTCFLTLLCQEWFRKDVPGRKIKLQELFSDLQMDWTFYLFLLCVVIVNTIYAWKENNGEFLKHTLYWLYNGMGIWCFRHLGSSAEFRKAVSFAAKINILIQSIIWLTGLGRLFYEYWGGTRYMGTANDPNQLAFFLFLMMLLLYLCEGNQKRISNFLFYTLAIVMIVASKSTGIFLGILVFAGTWSFMKLYHLYRLAKYPKWIWGIVGCCCAVCLAVGLWLLWPAADFSVQEGQFTLLQRVQEKIWKVSYGGFWGVLLDRGLDKFILYPQYLLFGAGEGGFGRFILAVQINEIHSSLFSIWFCYGTIPVILLLFWLGKQLSYLEGWMWPAILGLLAESFLLVNYRQPMFWLVLVFARVVKEEDKESKLKVTF